LLYGWGWPSPVPRPIVATGSDNPPVRAMVRFKRAASRNDCARWSVSSARDPAIWLRGMLRFECARWSDL